MPRSTLPEIMDDPAVPEADMHRVLEELAIVARLLGGHKVTLDALDRLKAQGHDVRSILDLGSGGGDSLRTVADWGRKRGVPLRLVGLDRNPAMTRYAESLSKNYPEISYLTYDVFDPVLDDTGGYDVVMSSLFCHHFADDALVLLIRRMVALCETAVVVNDLHRHRIARESIRLLTRIFSKSYMVRYDAPLSVARAFTRADWRRLLAAAGVRRYTLRWRWAWRWQLTIPKQPIDAGAL